MLCVPCVPGVVVAEKMADFYEDKQLTMKQFLVVLAMGYVLDAIPDLMEVRAQSQRTCVL